MKISIDTKEDSHEEIRNVIKILKHLVGDDGSFGKLPDSGANFSNVEDVATPMASMFGDPQQQQPSQELSPEPLQEYSPESMQSINPPANADPEELSSTVQPSDEDSQNSSESPAPHPEADSSKDLFDELFSGENLGKVNRTEPSSSETQSASAASIFDNISLSSGEQLKSDYTEPEGTVRQEEESSTEDLFEELFSNEDLEKMRQMESLRNQNDEDDYKDPPSIVPY